MYILFNSRIPSFYCSIRFSKMTELLWLQLLTYAVFKCCLHDYFVLCILSSFCNQGASYGRQHARQQLSSSSWTGWFVLCSALQYYSTTIPRYRQLPRGTVLVRTRVHLPTRTWLQYYVRRLREYVNGVKSNQEYAKCNQDEWGSMSCVPIVLDILSSSPPD